MRIAYVALMLRYQAGVINKLESYANVCKRENIPIDYYWITSSDEYEPKGHLNVIKVPRNIVRARIEQARMIDKLSQSYPNIILRYPLADPVLVSVLRNRKAIYIEHHTKEHEELKMKRDPRYLCEKYIAPMWIRSFAGLIGVTPEIIDYEVERSGFNKATKFIPNTIDTTETIENHIGDSRDCNIVNMLMVANFRPWHGITQILSEVQHHQSISDKFRLHIVGKLQGEEERYANTLGGVKYHGFLKKADLSELYKLADIGLGTFQLDVLSMYQTTSLKVREYLRNGIAIAIGTRDAALPESFPYALQLNNFSMLDILDYAHSIKGVPRAQIRDAAIPYIDSKNWLNDLYNWVTSR